MTNYFVAHRSLNLNAFFIEMFESGMFTNLTLISNDAGSNYARNRLHVHKIIFHNMTEIFLDLETRDVIKIDCDSETLKRFVHYMYGMEVTFNTIDELIRFLNICKRLDVKDKYYKMYLHKFSKLHINLEEEKLEKMVDLLIKHDEDEMLEMVKYKITNFISETKTFSSLNVEQIIYLFDKRIVPYNKLSIHDLCSMLLMSVAFNKVNKEILALISLNAIPSNYPYLDKFKSAHEMDTSKLLLKDRIGTIPFKPYKLEEANALMYTYIYLYRINSKNLLRGDNILVLSEYKGYEKYEYGDMVEVYYEYDVNTKKYHNKKIIVYNDDFIY